MQKLVSMVVISIGIFSSAALAQERYQDMELRAALYHLGLLETSVATNLGEDNGISILNHIPGEVCFSPDTTGCITFVAGSYASSEERIQAARACAGNFGQECVTFVAGSYPGFGERVAAAQTCKENLGADCAKFVAGSFPSSSERIEAAQACRMADVGCVKAVAGSYPSFSERANAARACGGQ